MEITKIEIWWKGPFTVEEACKFDSQHTDFGIYQIYGTHNIFGPNSLLYIGKAADQTFAARIKQHPWLTWEASDINIYIGKVGGLGKDHSDNETWVREISEAELLLINYCSPPRNAQNIKSYGKIHNTLVLNFDKRNRIPREVSTLYNESEFWENREWNVYGGSDSKFDG